MGTANQEERENPPAITDMSANMNLLDFMNVQMHNNPCNRGGWINPNIDTSNVSVL